MSLSQSIRDIETQCCPVVAPLRGQPASARPWEGSRQWKGRNVTAIIPVLAHSPLLELAIESLLLQDEQPFIILVDTGSVEPEPIEALRTRNQIDVISVRSSGWRHPSQCISAGLDAAWGCVQTPFAYYSHDDVILKRRDLISEMVGLVKTKSPVVGYQISPREYEGWASEVGHTCLAVDVKRMDEIGATWNLRGFATITGESLDPAYSMAGRVDTERHFNMKLRQAGINPHFIGFERNYERTNDDQIDHVRSRTSGLLYSPTHSAKAELWESDAITQARLRHSSWLQ